MTTSRGHVESADLLLSAAHAVALGPEDQAHVASCVQCRREYEAIEAALGDRRRAVAGIVSRRSRAVWDGRRAGILAQAQKREVGTRVDWRRAALAASLFAALAIPAAVDLAPDRGAAPAVQQRADSRAAAIADERRTDADDAWLRELTRLSFSTDDDAGWRVLAPLPPEEGADW